MNKIISGLILGSGFAFSSISYSATTEAIITDFQSGTTGNWAHGSIDSPNPPIVTANDGPSGAGDFSLWIEANGNLPAVPGSSAEGSELIALNRGNSTQKAVDALSLAASVSDGKIAMDLKHVSGNADYNIRFALGNSKLGKGGTWYVSQTPHTLTQSNSGNWEHAEFDLSDLVKYDDSAAPGNASLEQVLGGIFEVRLLHNPALSAKGDRVQGIFAADNIMALLNDTTPPPPAGETRAPRHAETFQEAVDADIQAVLNANGSADQALAKSLIAAEISSANVSAVPLPPAFGLFALALAGLSTFAKKRS